MDHVLVFSSASRESYSAPLKQIINHLLMSFAWNIFVSLEYAQQLFGTKIRIYSPTQALQVNSFTCSERLISHRPRLSQFEVQRADMSQHIKLESVVLLELSSRLSWKSAPIRMRWLLKVGIFVSVDFFAFVAFIIFDWIRSRECKLKNRQQSKQGVDLQKVDSVQLKSDENEPKSITWCDLTFALFPQSQLF